MKLDAPLINPNPASVSLPEISSNLDTNANPNPQEALPYEGAVFSSILQVLAKSPEVMSEEPLPKPVLQMQEGDIDLDNQKLSENFLQWGMFFTPMNMDQAKPAGGDTDQLQEMKGQMAQQTNKMMTAQPDLKNSLPTMAQPAENPSFPLAATVKEDEKEITALSELSMAASQPLSQSISQPAKQTTDYPVKSMEHHSSEQQESRVPVQPLAQPIFHPEETLFERQPRKMFEKQTLGAELSLSAIQSANTQLNSYSPMPLIHPTTSTITLSLPASTKTEGPAETKAAVITLDLPEKSQLLQLKEMYSVNMKIYPPELGQVTAKLKMDKTGANLIMMADNNHIKEIIQAGLPQLRDHFQRMDIQINHIDVQVTDMQTASQGQEKQSQQQSSPLERQPNTEKSGSPHAQLVESKHQLDVNALVDTYA